MNPPPPEEVTQLLLAWSRGNDSALDELIPLVYAELRRLASSCMRKENRGHTLQTALDEALTERAEFDPPKARLVELRFFGGLSVEDTAEVMKLSPVTIYR